MVRGSQKGQGPESVVLRLAWSDAFHHLAFRTPTFLTSHNSIAVVSLTPADGYPRLTRALVAELRQLLDMLHRSSVDTNSDARVAADSELPIRGLFRGVVIASNSTSFATGAELEEVAALEGLAAREFARAGQTLFDQIERFPVPVVAAIRGYCLGGGLDLALACHARVASYDASLGHPGPTIGLLTGWGGTQRLPRLLGKAAALQVLLTADRIPATQALTLGLVNELVPSKDLPSAACRYVERFVRRASP